MNITFKDGIKFGIGFVIGRGICDVIGRTIISTAKYMTNKYLSDDEISQLNRISSTFGGYQFKNAKKSVAPKVMNKIGF